MSIENIYTRAWNDNVIVAVQQILSKLRDRVLIKTDFKGESTTFDVIGKVTARKKTSRHAEAVIDDPTYSRVHCYTEWFYHAEQLDTDDKLKTVVDPTSAVLQASMAAMRRKIDETIIGAINGTKYTGKNGTTTSSLPSAQKIAAGGSGMTLAKLIQTAEILNSADVPEDEPRYLAIAPKQVSDLLNISQVTSADYNTVRALASGKLPSFMGFDIIVTNLLNTNASSETLCLAWTKTGVGLAVSQDITATVTQGGVKDHLAWQSYVGMAIGATRIEDERVVEIACA